MQEFKTPFSKAYWKAAVSELKKPGSLVLAALFIALRVAVKAFNIPIPWVENQHIGLDFLVNSVGAMIYGPVVGMLGGAVSDTIGAFLFPQGPYFFPYIFLEMSSSFLFGLFLYRSHLTPSRVILSRFAVTVGCNMLLTPAIMNLERFYKGKAAVKFFTLSRLVKNVILFPLEALLLVIFLSAVGVVLAKMKVIPASNGKMEIRPKHVILLCVLAALTVGILALYVNGFLTPKP